MSDSLRDEVLAAVLGAHSLRVSIVAAPEYCGTWFEDEPPSATHGSFHLIDTGSCWARSPVLAEPVQLHQGDLILLPRGSPHTLSSEPAAVAAPASAFSTLICGQFEYAGRGRDRVLAALPDALVVRAGQGGEPFRDLGRALSYIARHGTPGQRVMLDKLAESLFVMAFCAHAASTHEPRGLLAALAHPRLARALAAMHAEPGRAWRVDQLAGIAAMSRTAFAQEFSARLGTSPIQYLTDWRIAQAQRLLHDPQQSVAAIAERLGYQSEAAFRRTFKRVTGVGPGQLRRAAR
jgi:AraC family transcriptional regulator, activator of mtrCDE